MNTKGLIAALCIAVALAYIGYALMQIHGEMEAGNQTASERADIAEKRACIADSRLQAEHGSPGFDYGGLPTC